MSAQNAGQQHENAAKATRSPESEELEESLVNLEQRENYFLKLNVHYTEIEKIQTRQINQLFKKITYKRDDVGQFRYDH